MQHSESYNAHVKGFLKDSVLVGWLLQRDVNFIYKRWYCIQPEMGIPKRQIPFSLRQ